MEEKAENCLRLGRAYGSERKQKAKIGDGRWKMEDGGNDPMSDLLSAIYNLRSSSS
jgi:hypothetical protein